MKMLLEHSSERVMVRHVLPAAINCFFHVYEERLGRYGLRVLKHVLVFPDQYEYVRLEMKTGCDWIVAPYAYVTVTNDVVVDRTWCKTCATSIAAESKRGHSPNSIEEILAPPVRPLTKEVL